jgi:staphylococcal nuclease domain-containing protein 1
VGKEISFTSIHSLPSNDDIPRDLGNADIAGVDLTTELLKNGWAKLKEIKREASEEDSKRKDIEAEAKSGGKGIWNPHGPQVRLISGHVLCSPHSETIFQKARVVNHSMPTDSQGFLTEWKGKAIDGNIDEPSSRLLVS